MMTIIYRGIIIAIFTLKTVLATDFALGLLNPNFSNRTIININAVKESVLERSDIKCVRYCHKEAACRSCAFNKDTNKCTLYDKDFIDTSDATVLEEKSWSYYFVVPLKASTIPESGCYQYPESNQRPCDLFCMRYVTHATRVHIAAAAAECAGMNGGLVKVDRELKQFCVEKLLAVVTDGVVYIQGKKTNGIWRFDDGTEMTYFNWNTEGNQPDNYDGEDYIGIRRNKDYMWHDFFDSQVQSFVCDIH